MVQHVKIAEKGYDLIGVQFKKKSLICNKFYTNKPITDSYYESLDKF